MGSFKFRRVVTANTKDGRSYIASDGDSPHILQFGTDRALIDMWGHGPNAGPDIDGVVQPMRLEPPTNGTIMRLVQLPPRSSEQIPSAVDDMEKAFDVMGAPHARDAEARHPGMHRTDTLDIVLVLEGHLKMLVDDGEVELKPFDVVIQRATNHAWENLEEKPALIAGMLIDLKGE